MPLSAAPGTPSWLVRVLLDENLPRALAVQLREYDAFTVQALGWSGMSNGELLRRARGDFDAVLTMDRGLPYQQDLSDLGLGVLIVRAPSNRMVHLKPLVDTIQRALRDLGPGQVRTVGA